MSGVTRQSAARNVEMSGLNRALQCIPCRQSVKNREVAQPSPLADAVGDGRTGPVRRTMHTHATFHPHWPDRDHRCGSQY